MFSLNVKAVRPTGATQPNDPFHPIFARLVS